MLKKSKEFIIVIGVHKSGTTSLYNYLGDHINVFRPLKKELHYFTPIVYGKEISETSIYMKYFDEAKKIEKYYLDVSPSYLYGKKKIIYKIKEVCGNPKILILLRDPVKRFISFYKQGIKVGAISYKTSLETFFKKSLIEFNKFKQSGIQLDSFENRAIREGCYSEYISDWLNEFGEDFKVVFFEDFIENTSKEMQHIVEWLRINDIYKNYIFSNSSPAFTPRNQLLSKIVYHSFIKYETFFRKHHKLKNRLKHIYKKINGSSVKNKKTNDISRLIDFYKPYNFALNQIFKNHNLPTHPWK